MNYDPIKDSLGNFFNQSTGLRKLFYRLLDLLLLRTWHIHKELKIWEKSAPKDAKVLDAGSGFGQYSYYIARRNPDFTILGLDVKEKQIDDCNNFFQKADLKNVKFGIADLTVYTQPDYYDLIVCVDVMEHILEDVKVFENYSISLKKGGMLLISTPSDQGGSDVTEEGGESFIGEHVRDGYNIDEIKDKLRASGFSRVEARYSYGAPGKIAWRLSMKYPIKMLGISKVFFIILPFYYLITFPISLVLNYLDTHNEHPTGTGLVVKAWK